MVGWCSGMRWCVFFFFKQKTAYELRISDWSSDVCSSDLILPAYDWGKEKGFKKYFLVGSDYVFPRTANLILKKHIENDKLTLSGEEYQPMGGTDFSGVIAKIKAAKPDRSEERRGGKECVRKCKSRG